MLWKNKKLIGFATIVGALFTVLSYFANAENSEKVDNSNNNTIKVEGSNNNSITQQNINTVNIYNQSKSVNSNDKDKVDEKEKLEKIFIGAGRKYIESLFGIPIIDIKHARQNIIETNYSFDDFYLQFLYNSRGEVQFYSLTSKNKNFNPIIPGFNMSLGKHTFSEYGNGMTHIYSYLTARHYGYAEYLYLGSIGNYHNYYLGYNSTGVDYGDIYPFVNYSNTNEWDKFRNKCIPNTFGIGEIGELSNNDLLDYEMGIEFYTARDIQ